MNRQRQVLCRCCFESSRRRRDGFGTAGRDRRGTLAGINQAAKVRIPSMTGTAAYRIPDELTDTSLTEVKNVATLSYTNQLRDFYWYVSLTGRSFNLIVRVNDIERAAAGDGGCRCDQPRFDPPREMMATPPDLARDLRAAGLPISDLWQLVNAKTQYKAAIPVLIDWLRNVERRVPGPDQPRVREGLVRALSVPAARPGAAPALIEEFRKAADPSETGLGWVVGNALSVVADDSVFDEISGLVRDPGYGKARQMIVLGLGRSKDPRAVPLLVGLLGDEDVAAHAVMALGRLRPVGARPAVERLLDHPQALVRREAKKALARLPA